MIRKIGLVILLLAAWPLASAGSRVADTEAAQRAHFVYYFDDPRYIDAADSLLNRVRRQLLVMLGDTLPYRPAVYLVGDQQQFNRLLGGRFPDWGAAAAVPERGAIVVKSPDKFNVGKSLAELLAHEYAHLVVAHRSGFHSVPRWYDEGVAMLVSTEWSWSDNLAMGKAAVFGEFIPLSKIEMVNRFNQSQAQVAYAQSYLAVKYLIDNYGGSALKRFLDAVSVGASLDDALMASCGASSQEFENEFREHLRLRYNIVTLFTDTMYLWIALALIVLVGVFLRYRKRRQYYKKWEQEETLQSTDFHYGDPAHPEKIDDDDEPWRG